jgi:hypothetical protein
MATLGNTYPSLIDLYKNLAGGEVVNDIIEILAQTTPMIQDMAVMECNQGTTNLATIRTGLPEATWRELYQGVQPTKATNKQVTDATGMLEAWSEIDSKLVEISGNSAQFRMNEAEAHIQGMGHTMESTMFYGTAANEFTGLTPRFNDLSAENASQIVDAGGTGSDNASIWMVVWGANTVHGLYPKGSMAGLQRQDKGMVTKENDDGMYDVHREKFTWDLGVAVKDYRYVARVCNIDVSDMQAGSVELYTFLRKAYYALKQRQIPNGQAAIYCNTDVMEALDALATNNGTTDNFVRLNRTEIEGQEVITYRGIPIRETDALLNTEARVV